MKAELLAMLRVEEQTVRSMVLTIMGVANLSPLLSTRCQVQVDLHFLLPIFKQFLLGTMPECRPTQTAGAASPAGQT